MLSLNSLPSLRRQQLLSEFAGLKQACPEGIFVTLTPGDPTLWSAVLFVRGGPYAQAILRFQLSFPDSYPKQPPLVLFSTDMFHPLITPLTTYMYTADSQDSGTVSARDFEERLPPGGFSLRHGFPEWFGRARRRPSGACGQAGGEQARSPAPSSDCSPKTGGAGRPGYQRTDRPSVSMYRILGYIRSVFDDERVLDSVPLEAAGNPGAWHAWRTHQRRQGKLRGEPAPAQEPEAPAGSHQGAWPQSPAAHAGAAARQPGEWNWDGVWEDRVKKGIATSLSEPVLYGGSAAPDELIRFLAMEESDVNSVKENLRSTLGTVG